MVYENKLRRDLRFIKSVYTFKWKLLNLRINVICNVRILKFSFFKISLVLKISKQLINLIILINKPLNQFLIFLTTLIYNYC